MFVFKFAELNTKIDVPEGMQYYKRDEAVKVLHLEAYNDNVLLVLREPKEGFNLLVSHLGKVKDSDDFIMNVKVFAEGNEKLGNKVLKRKKLELDDGRQIAVVDLQSAQGLVCAVFIMVGSGMYMLNTLATEDKFKAAKVLLLELAKSLNVQ